MHDLFQRPIRVGDVVCAPARKGSRCWLRVVRVTDVQPRRLGGWLPNGRHVTLWGDETLGQIAIIKGGSLQAAADRQRDLAAAS